MRFKSSLWGLILLLATGSACRHVSAAESLQMQEELERALDADALLVSDIYAGRDNFEAFLRKHGEKAVTFFERLVKEAARSGDGGDFFLIRAAIDGLVFLKDEHAKPALEELASSDKVNSFLSREAFDAWVKLSPRSERLGMLVARLRLRQDPEDQKWTVSDLIGLGLPDAVPYLKDIRPTISDGRTARFVEKAIKLLEDPGICSVYQESFTEKTRKWGCLYSCAGPVRSREWVMDTDCPKTIPNEDQ